MLTPLDDSPWHQLPTTFDHVGTSDPRFFDRFWFSAANPAAPQTLQFTLGVYPNMNVVDGGFVVVHEGRQHNVRVSRQLRPRYETAVGPLRFEVVEPFQTDRAHRCGESLLVWRGSWSGRRPSRRRRSGIISTGSGVGSWRTTAATTRSAALSGHLDVAGTSIAIDEWWACRDHSWGVRERVGIPEPYTGEVPQRTGSVFAFLFFSTDTHGGHIQLTAREDGGHLTASSVVDRGHRGRRPSASGSRWRRRSSTDGRPAPLRPNRPRGRRRRAARDDPLRRARRPVPPWR